MAPSPQERAEKISDMGPGLDDDSVVISGMSGAFPKSRHVKDFENILYNKVDPLAEPNLRWVCNNSEVPAYAGSIPDLDRFDAPFFKVNTQLATAADPMSRKLKEYVYSAIYDAGISPESLSGRIVGVYTATSLSETERTAYHSTLTTSSTLPGCSKAMFSNRISYWLNLRGPSMAVDDLCASGLLALEQAYLAIKRGDCEAAIVGSAGITLHPQTLVHFGRFIQLCKDGKTKSYDQSADGCVKSEAINVIFLQKKQDALRIYAEVVHAKTEYDRALVSEPCIGPRRNTKYLADFMHKFYKDAKVLPNEVEHFEGFGIGISSMDEAELKATEEVFCKDRSRPLMVGSVTSNIGYTEASMSLCSISKVLLGYQKGLMAANLHCSNPRQDVAALRDGRMQILNDHAPFNRSYAAVNSISVVGINGHALFRGVYKPKSTSDYKSDIPRLVTISGRQEFAVEKIIDDLSQRPIDPEELGLLHNIHEERNSGHLARGYVVLDSNKEGKTVCLAKSVEHYDDMKRPLWFVYSGMGSQWSGMGKDLMRIPTFAAAIEKCDQVLKPKGVDIKHIICSPDKTIFDNILHSFVGIAAVQIGLTDVLREMGMVPDKIIGHSVGELGCGYADGCFTAEEMILSAYSRGLVSVQTQFIRGSMAAVGIGYQQAVKLCPPGIEIACHNGPESCTISGPAEPMKEFVAQLTAQGIFAKEVPCSNIAYHSRYIAEAGPKLLEYLSAVIKNPKRRSDRWLSTSVPQERWSEENAQYCSAWYHTNNLLSPVLFEETSRLVPAGAVLVEVAPHGLLQAILKRSLHPDCRHIPLTKRGHADNALFFLQAVGNLFQQGYLPKIKYLYPEVQFPVSTETPGLSHLIEWNHNDTWSLIDYHTVEKGYAPIFSPHISIHDDENKYLRGNIVGGKNLYPFAAALVAVWDTYAASFGISQMPVQFSDVHLFAQPILLDKRQLDLKVTIHIGSGEFEVVTPLSKVATGNIIQYAVGLPQYESVLDDNTILSSEDIYKMFQERGYSYSGDFKSIHKSNYSFTDAQLLWNDNWVTLIDGMLQLNTIRRDHDAVSQPSHIHRLTIDLRTHNAAEKLLVGDQTVITTILSPLHSFTKCGGVLIEKLVFLDFPPLVTNVLELQTFDHKSVDGKIDKDKCDVLLHSDCIGDLTSLSWVATDDVMPPFPSNILVTVQYAGISVYDVNVATGVYCPKQGYLNRNVYGMEYSGTTDRGTLVMGLVRGGAAGSRVRAVPALTWPVPAHWTLEDAATVPLAYAQAFYCLGIKAQLYPGMRVLVHGGAGALGQAVISIALAHQCKVFTTVANDKKKQFLLRLFPALTEDVIGCSRNHSFADLILLGTNGEGCDVIISCSTGNIKNTTLECAAFGGITFDIAQAVVRDTYSYGMQFLKKQRSYVQVNFFSIFESKNFMKELQLMMSEGIARGYVRPLSRVTYAAQESARAFRLLAASQHRGRVLLRLRQAQAPQHARIACSPVLYQLVVCREKNYSLHIVDRLISRGAKKILLHFTQSSPLILYKIATWKNHGVDVQTSLTDLSNMNEVRILLEGKIFEGMFVICPGDNQDHLIISNLRKMTNPDLKYFSVITTMNSVKENWLKDEHRTTMVSLEKLYNAQSENITKRSVVDTIERALCSTHRMLNIHFKRKLKSSIFDDISKNAGISIPQDIKDEMTLQELGLDNTYAKTISVVLLHSYNTWIPDENIPTLTIRFLKEIEQYSKEALCESHDLSALVSYVNNDENLGASYIVVLPTLFKCVSVNDDEVDRSLQYMWVVPGVEGQHERFRTLCARLQLPALVLQPGGKCHDSAHQAAEAYVKVLRARANLTNHKDFYLLGYETGVLVALEMAAILEKEGLTGTVFCIGGCPDDVLLHLESNIKHLDTEDKLQNAVIYHMISFMSTGAVENVDTLLAGGSSLQDKQEHSLHALMKNVPQTSLYARSVIEGVYSRIKQALQYNALTRPLKSQVVLLNTKTSSKNKPGFNVDSLSKEPVTSYDLDVPLTYAAEHPLAATIVNSHLSAALMDAYKSQNHCDVVLPAQDVIHV